MKNSYMKNPYAIKTQILGEYDLVMCGDLSNWIFPPVILLGVILGFVESSFLLFIIIFVSCLVFQIVLIPYCYAKKVRDFRKLCFDYGMVFRKDLSSSIPDLFLFLGYSEEMATILIHHPVSKYRVRDVYVNLQDVLNIELSVDQSPVYQAGPIATLSGAAIGGAAFGGAGAIVGSIATSQVGKGKIGSITLKLRINDLHTPIIQIDFISKPIKSSGAKVPINIAENWTNLMEVMRHRIAKSGSD